MAEDVVMGPQDVAVIEREGEVLQSGFVALPKHLLENPELARDTMRKRVEALKHIIGEALRLTTTKDWVDFGGTPYLQASGAEKLIGPFGIRFRNRTIEPSLRDACAMWRDGIPVYFECTGTVVMGGFETEIVGGRNTDDGFFRDQFEWVDDPSGRKKADGTPWKVKSKLPPKPLTEVDIGDVRKSSVSNWEARAVSTCLGLRGLTWEFLAQYGIEPPKDRRVDFRQGKDDVAGQQQRQERRSEKSEGQSQAKGQGGSQKRNADARQRMVEQIRARAQQDEHDPDAFLTRESGGTIKSMLEVASAKDADLVVLYEKLGLGK